jgi:hypothetical protein
MRTPWSFPSGSSGSAASSVSNPIQNLIAGTATGSVSPGPPVQLPDRRASPLRYVRADRRNSRDPDADAAGYGTCASVDASRARIARCQIRLRRMLRTERAGTCTGPAEGPNTTNALKPSHNATPVQTRVAVMMCSRENRQESLAVICANQGSPEEYGKWLQSEGLRAAAPAAFCAFDRRTLPARAPSRISRMRGASRTQRNP